MSFRYTLIFSFLISIILPSGIVAMMGGSLLIDNRSYYSSKERSAVNFPHEKHMEKGIDCTRCHHDYLDEKNILDSDKLEVGNNEIKCINCHGKSGKARERHKLQQAYHGQCINCHRKIIGSRGGRPLFSAVNVTQRMEK